MTQILFYLQYAARNLYRERRWTTFAIFSIAAGVAAVVALRSLGLSIGDSLVDNVRNSLHGDILLSMGEDSPFAAMGDVSPNAGFSDAQIERIQGTVDEYDGQLSAYIEAGSFQVTAVDAVTVGRPQFISVFFVDPQTYAPTGDILAVDPRGVPLSELLTGGNEVVISQNLADSQGLSVGDTVRVTGTTDEYIVRGIVGVENEANIQNIFASFFGFAYLNIAQAEAVQINPEPNRIAIALPPGTDIYAVNRAIPNFGTRTRLAPDMMETYREIGDTIADFIVVLGLGALLIGGVGIINTMLVLVRRRTEEIAALKTFGLKGRQVAALFLSEAFLLGIAGSIVGCIVGVLLSGIVNQFGEAFLLQRLTWRLYPDAILYGLVLGMVTTMVFGIVPVLLTLRVRPAIILRPNETHVPTMGVLQSIGALLLIVISIGIMAGQIIGNVLIGMIGVAVVLIVFGILIGLLWIVVWLVGKLPSFGNVDVRLALRNLSTQRIRTAITLLALSAGMFALASITLVGQGVSEILRFQFREQFGGNVMVISLAGAAASQFGLGDAAQGILDNQLNSLEGLNQNTVYNNIGVTMTAIDGEEPVFEMPEIFSEFGDDSDQREFQQSFGDGNFSFSLTQRSRVLPSGNIVEGRDLTAEDIGQTVIVIGQGFLTTQFGVELGSVLTLRVNGRDYEFTVIGISGGTAGFNFGSGTAYIPPESLPSSAVDFSFNVLDVQPEFLNQALLSLSELPLVFAIDITFIDGLLTRLINQFAAIPTVVGLLSLLAAATIMANTVALATLERRRQIGVLKAVGLKGRRVLLIMLLENTLVGLLGALLGIGLSAIGVALLTSLSTGVAIPIPRDSALTVVALVAAAVVIAWIATFLSARTAVGERVLNVLRYE